MRPTLHNLQALRGLACLLVVAYHAAGWEGLIWVKTPVMTGARWFAYAGVDLFFVLSGFIITWTHADQLGHAAKLPKYLTRRAWRIYPTLWASCIVATVIANAVTGAEVFTLGWLGDWVEWLLLVPRYDPHRFIAATWSLNYEVMFYLAFGLLYFVPKRFAAMLACVWAGVIVAAKLAGHTPTPFWGKMLLSPFVLEFLAGALVAAVVKRGTIAGPRWCLLAAFAWLAVFIPLLQGATPDDLGNRFGPRVLAFGPACALIVYAVVAGELTGRVRLPRFLRPVGDASYSIYLLHGPVGLSMLFLTWGMGHSPLVHLLWLAILAGSGIAAGWLMYRLVERPLLNWGKRPSVQPAVHVHVLADRANVGVDQPGGVRDAGEPVAAGR
ncbi:acyltransferase family protein [Limnoglobus roseus]|uniref:Acyltransferase n=1 Tax=Limnoglobus roseus TaxID=2598579 RepID=A0A5C1A8H9_9BACT|nr:acyltransferase [Limnoglobus roseus]QEL14316.1 acyltransferase [Limnoglobus roseus]